MEETYWNKRMPGESAKAYDAFSIYRDMGVGRSVEAAWWSSTDEGKNGASKGEKTVPGYWKNWSTKFKWRSRCEAYDDRQAEIKRKIKEEEESEQYRIEIRENARDRREKIKALRLKQWEIACELQKIAKVAIQSLRKNPDKISLNDVNKSLELSFKLEKESLRVTDMPSLTAIETLANEGLCPPEMIEFFEEVINEPIALTSEKISELYIERLKNE